MSLIEDDTTNWKNWKIQLLLPLTVKFCIKSVYKPFKQLYKLLKKLKSRRISLPKPPIHQNGTQFLHDSLYSPRMDRNEP
jgi:hypothetical protein